MIFANRRIVFVGNNVVVYNVVDLLPRHKNYPYGARDVVKPNGKPAVSWRYRAVNGRHIKKLYVHQTAGSVTYSGWQGLLNTASFFVRNPSWNSSGQWTGRGRGWPGFAYTWYLPYAPETYDGKPIVFQTNNLEDVTTHSGDNSESVAIALQGYFRSRHMRTFVAKPGCPGGVPSSMQMRALHGFLQEYRLHLHSHNSGFPAVLGHCHSPRPKLTCPGDALEQIIEHDYSPACSTLPVDVPFLVPLPGMVLLPTWKQRQAALVLLGCDIGNSGPYGNGCDGDPGNLTRLATEDLERSWGLPIDGYWDDVFDYHVKVQLLVRGLTQADIDKTIK